MLKLYVIRACVQLGNGDVFQDCLAICSDPDTPIAFVLVGHKVITEEVYHYRLEHLHPWVEVVHDDIKKYKRYSEDLKKDMNAIPWCVAVNSNKD